MTKFAKKGVTLVELLVVVAIIGILAAVLLGTLSGGTESARAAKCLTNMRNLAAACQNYGMVNDYYPTAGSYEAKVYENEIGEYRYKEHRGWIGWYSKGAYKSSQKASVRNQSWHTTTYDTDKESRTYVLTNSALWKYVSHNADVYRCPVHVQNQKDNQGPSPNWSYVMNAYFGWDRNKEAILGGCAHHYNSLQRADRRLLFAELPLDISHQNDELIDCVLQYDGCKGCGTAEWIGFNHKIGKRNTYGHICFADGHVEKLLYPRSGMTDQEMKELTKWLCEGKDVSFDGSKYVRLTAKSDDD